MRQSEPALEARGLQKRFGDVVALAGIDLEVPQGSVLGLLGPNGAGKTTAVRILSTVLTPDAGTARVLGLDVVSDAARVRARIGLAGQFAAVDGNLTGSENLRLMGSLAHLPARAVRTRAAELIEMFGLAHAADRPAKTYSGGMRRRLDLAAALVHRPPVLFLDEPTTGLDPASRNDLWAAVRGLVGEGTTVLLTTQYLEEADELAERIVVISGGRAVADGAAHELKAEYGRSRIEVRMPDAAAAASAVDVVRAAGLGAGEASGDTLTVAAVDGAAAVVELVQALDHAGLDPRAATVREPTLDDVFLSLTGHTASAPDAAPVPEEVR